MRRINPAPNLFGHCKIFDCKIHLYLVKIKQFMILTHHFNESRLNQSDCFQK